MYQEYSKDGFSISTDPAKLDVAVIHQYLSQESYWAENIPIATVEKSIKNSLCFGLFHNDQQMGFARIISDFATFAYLCDVFVLETFRGRGLSKWLMESVLAHPDLQGLRRIMLMTKDAHGLYTQYGFAPLEDAGKCMAITKPGLYKNL